MKYKTKAFSRHTLHLAAAWLLDREKGKVFWVYELAGGELDPSRFSHIIFMCFLG